MPELRPPLLLIMDDIEQEVSMSRMEIVLCLLGLELLIARTHTLIEECVDDHYQKDLTNGLERALSLQARLNMIWRRK
jgi:hypothetical protein